MAKSNQHSDLLGDFFKGAVKGIITGALLMGAMFLVFQTMGALAPILNFAAPAMPELFGMSHLSSLVAIMLTSGLVNGVLRAYTSATVQNHEARGNMREAHITQTSPTLIPLLGMEHGIAADHALEVEHHDRGSQRQWAQSVGHRGDRVQQILQNGSMSDKDRAAAILQEREARNAASQAVGI